MLLLQCLAKPPVKEITIPVDLKLHTDVRALDRAGFDEQVPILSSFSPPCTFFSTSYCLCFFLIWHNYLHFKDLWNMDIISATEIIDY